MGAGALLVARLRSSRARWAAYQALCSSTTVAPRTLAALRSTAFWNKDTRYKALLLLTLRSLLLPGDHWRCVTQVFCGGLGQIAASVFVIRLPTLLIDHWFRPL